MSATPGATQKILLQLWLNGHVFYLLTSSRVGIDQMFTDYRNTGMWNGIGTAKGKSKGVGWRCLANNNGCESRSRAGVRKAAATSYGG